MILPSLGATCETNWYQLTVGSTDYCYRVIEVNTNWASAKSTCEATHSVYLGRIHALSDWNLIKGRVSFTTRHFQAQFS